MKARIGDEVRDLRAVWFDNGKVMMIDQRELPHKIEIVGFDDHMGVAEAIKNMTTRGAPAIGAAAAYGMCLASLSGIDLDRASKDIKAARPTANDLFFAVDHMYALLKSGSDPVKAADGYADMIVDKCTKIGEYGSSLIKDGMKIMTHCNAGALATVDVGTALAPMRKAWADGKRFFVYASETRPRLQGMQLTAWELGQEGIDHAVIPDGASAYYMEKGVDLIITGADRITANGDFANKIGTFDKAIAAKHFGIPFYVAAPVSTFDFNTRTGKEIEIEQRSEKEVTEIYGMRIAPAGSPALNPAFDVTPAELVAGFITEKGIFSPKDIRKVIDDE
ncbi:MAG: S-methyl-5-thioribose-1-phosphate isomerase [Methanomassiliicoccaceae archaeon]|nr:S-methyl-5-thioribose-1-phosphate isomerase [Methanomassiliicoccaceae archaeon]